MTPKEKAKELVDKMYYSRSSNDYIQTGALDVSKQCALIAVDEIINASPRFPNNADWDDSGGTHEYYYEEERKQAELYWQEVKQEIEKV